MLSIGTLLKNSRDAQYLVLEAGKSPAGMVGSGSIKVSEDQVTPADIQQIIAAVIPEDKRAALLAQPMARCRLNFPGLGPYELTITRDGTGSKLAFRPLENPTVAAAPAAPVATNQVSPQAASAPAPPTNGGATMEAVVAAAGAPTPGIQLGKRGALEIDQFFSTMLRMKASDLHISTSVLPMVRKDGEMLPMEGATQELTANDTKRILWELMPDKNREEFRQRHDTDFAYEFGEDARFRCNIFMDRKGMGAVFRVIPSKILTAEELGLSKEILKLCFLSKGLVVVTGPTGSGKSTTLCGMVDYINRNRTDHIITIEDPIEFVHPNKKCLINQREVHNHTDSFKNALRAALREDPDIILVGEMRDLETIAIAIETAETGHLVFGTLHTSTAPSTVDRIIDQFPADRQSQIRVMLSESLKGVIAQTLCRKIGGGRAAALEVLLVDHAISNLIREAKTMQIPSQMQTSKGKGNVTLNEALMDLVKKKIVEPKEAYVKAVDKAGFEMLLNREKVDMAWLKEMGGSTPAQQTMAKTA